MRHRPPSNARFAEPANACDRSWAGLIAPHGSPSMGSSASLPRRRLGVDQGAARDRGQLDLRVAYCAGLGRRVLCSVRHWVVPGVGREANVLPEGQNTAGVRVCNLTWNELVRQAPRSTARRCGPTSPGRRSTPSSRRARAAQPPLRPDRLFTERICALKGSDWTVSCLLRHMGLVRARGA